MFYGNYEGFTKINYTAKHNKVQTKDKLGA